MILATFTIIVKPIHDRVPTDSECEALLVDALAHARETVAAMNAAQDTRRYELSFDV